MEWTQLKVNGKLEDKDTICAVMMLLDNQIMIEDYSDIDLDGFSNWYTIQAQEERDHAMLFVKYLSAFS